jgi:uncharacterized membrane protein YeiH
VIYLLERIGVAFFAVSGVAASRSKRPDLVGAIILAFATALGGGVIRDVLCNEMPSLLRSGERYITTCLIGGLVGLVVFWLGASMDVAGAVIASVTIAFRLLSNRFEWRLSALD